MSPGDLCEIGLAARSLWERLEQRVTAEDRAAPLDAEARLGRWRQSVAGGDEHAFIKRLEWDGLEEPALGRALSSEAHGEQLVHAQWLDTLADIVCGAHERAQLEQVPEGPFTALLTLIRELPIRAGFTPDAALPFEDVWVPVLAFARRKLISRLGASEGVASHPIEFTPNAYAALEHDLLQRLTSLGDLALYEAFRQDRGTEQDLRLLFLGASSGKKHRYNEFVQRLSRENLLPLFRSYPVLARLVVLATDQWLDATVEFIERLGRDAAMVRALAISPGDTSGRVLRVYAIRAGLSDPHNGGRKVIAVHFDSEQAVVYKPKSLATEAAFNALIEWCNANGVSSGLRALRCLDRGEYGWEEHAEHQPCANASERRRFYERAGALLCLLHVLRVTDCHRENLIACGEFPVLVDGETVMHPDARPPEPALIRPEEQRFQNSVVRTGLLPEWYVNNAKRLAMDVSALGGSGRDQVSVVSWKWQAINTDDMHRGPESVALAASESEPGVDRPDEHVEDLVSGFRSTYANLMRQRAAVLAPEGPLEAFRKLSIRFIGRPTLVYGGILRGALAPERLASGNDHSVALDSVFRGFLHGSRKPSAWRLARAELRALERLDIPYFLTPCDTDALLLPDGSRIENYFAAAGLAQVISGIQSMDEDDLEFQTTIIRGAFAARAMQLTDSTSHAVSDTGPAAGECTRLSATELTDEARRIAERVCACMYRAPDGVLHWLGLREIQGTSRVQLAPLNDSLYDGNCGIALFLASLAHLDSDHRLQDCALGAIARVRSHVRHPRAAEALVQHGTIGGALGLGSIAYALARIGELLGDGSIMADAHCAAELLSDQRIEVDSYFDVMAGSAGAILGLLAVELATGSGTALERAVSCGRRLLASRVAYTGRSRAWRNVAPVPLTGFSHGAAGIAYALARLHSETGAPEFLEAALEGIDYEHSLFDVASNNWPDLRDTASAGGEQRFAYGWCNGAPGIGLARLGTLRVVNDERLRADVDAALRTTLACDAKGADHLCCGTMGRLETLMIAAIDLARNDLGIVAHNTAATVVGRARHAGVYRLPGLAADALCPGLFSGLSGIGYQLLRLAHPARVPSVLLWQ